MVNSCNIQRLTAFMQQSARFASSSINRAASEFGTSWTVEFEIMLETLYASGDAMEVAVKGYGSFVIDSMRRQKRFEVDRSYPAKTYAQAAAEVYLNDDYMERQYLPGLLLSHYLWTHHFQQIKYFKSFFIDSLRGSQVTDFAEIGVGTGIYSRIALQEIPKIRGLGIDISPLSLQFTQQHVNAYGFGERYKVSLQNILMEPPAQKYQAVICVEVLEHLEDPVTLLRGLKAMLASNGRLFVTAALNAAHADHIYLYREPADVMAQVEEAGFHVENSFFANAYAPDKKGVPVPAALAMVLSHKKGSV
jgi:2-polyprenyl-3-methyl-5-hydroxy-6-metoxy-1,4-benzoquinol methylase